MDHRRCERMDRRRWYPAASSPSLFVGSGAGGLLLVQEGEGGVGWPHPLPGDHQEEVGRGHEDHRRAGDRRRLHKLVGLLPKVHSNRR